MEAGPWSGLPVADPSPWGRWEGRVCLGPGIAGSGLQDCLKKGVEGVRGVLGKGAGSFRQPLCPGFSTDVWEGAVCPGIILLGLTRQGPWLTSSGDPAPCSSLALLLLPRRIRDPDPQRKWRRLTIPVSPYPPRPHTSSPPASFSFSVASFPPQSSWSPNPSLTYPLFSGV